MEDACDGDIELCTRCLADYISYIRTAEAPERLRLAASEYVDSVESVKAQQETLLEVDLTNSAKVAATEAATCIACFKEAWTFMQSWQTTPTIPELCGAHGILGSFACKGLGAGHFRTRALRVGQCRFIPHTEVPTFMARYVQALEHVVAREDLSPHAKAAWAAYHFLAIHPFPDANGRFARLLINWVLLQAGVPFVVVLCGSEDRRAIWHEALLTGHRKQGCSQPLAGLIATTLARVWGGLEHATERAIRAKEEAAEDRALRAARDRAKEGICGVCLETGPNMILVCCGAAYHLSCMSQWLSTAPKGACPACRASIPQLPWLPQPSTSTATSSMPSASHHLERIAAALAHHPAMEPHPFTGEMPQFLVMASMQGLCAFCSNQRAADCALRACGRCCAANQRLHGVHCSRHALEHRDAVDWSDGTMSSNFSDDSTEVSFAGPPMPFVGPGLPHRGSTFLTSMEERYERHGLFRMQDGRTPAPPAPWVDYPSGVGTSSSSSGPAPAESSGSLNHLCAICGLNTRAGGCAFRACRTCCHLRAAGPCAWHSPPYMNNQAGPPPSYGTGSSSSMQPAQTGECRFCGNLAAFGCSQHACRRCCMASATPCERHRL